MLSPATLWNQTMSRKKLPAEVAELVASLLPASVPDDPQYVGRKLYGRRETEFESVGGEITGTSLCRLEGCGGTRLHVKWSDGKRTYPCAKVCDEQEDGSLRIR